MKYSLPVYNRNPKALALSILDRAACHIVLEHESWCILQDKRHDVATELADEMGLLFDILPEDSDAWRYKARNHDIVDTIIKMSRFFARY